jgi:hypothetical protein
MEDYSFWNILPSVYSDKTTIWATFLGNNLFVFKFVTVRKNYTLTNACCSLSKVFPLQALVGPWGSGRLRFRIFSTFGTVEVVRSSPLRTDRLYPHEYPGTYLYRLSRPQGTWFRRELRNKSAATPLGIDPETLRSVAQCLNHYATSECLL